MLTQRAISVYAHIRQIRYHKTQSRVMYINNIIFGSTTGLLAQLLKQTHSVTFLLVRISNYIARSEAPSPPIALSAAMAFIRPRLERSTQFMPSLASNQENYRSPSPDSISTDANLVETRELHTNQRSVETLSLLEGTAVKSQMRSDIPITSGSLWNKYQLIHKRRLGGLVIVVFESSADNDHYLIRRMKVAKDEVLSFRKRWLSHDNLSKTHEVFEDGGEFYCVMESALVTLLHVCRCPQYLNEKQLVAITKQVGTPLTQFSLITDVNRCLPGLLT